MLREERGNYFEIKGEIRGRGEGKQGGGGVPHDWVGRLDLTRPAQWRNSLGEFHKKNYYILIMCL